MKSGPKSGAGKLRVVQNSIVETWNDDPHLRESITVARRMRNTKHGLYANVPIICKGDGCPYKGNCFLYEQNMAPTGQKCPIEIAAIEDLVERYCKDLNIDPNDPRHTIDLVMVKELVDIDVALLRCDNKMAITADFILDNVVNVTDDGNAIYRQELHPVIEYKEKLRNSKYKTLQLLNSTRKDKEGSKVHIQMDPSERAAEMMKLKKQLEIIDVESAEDEERYYEKCNPVAIELQPVDWHEDEKG